MLLLSLNEAFPRRTTDLLLGLAKADELIVSGEGVLECAPLLASDLVYYVELGERIPNGIDAVCQAHEIRYLLRLTGKGRSVVEAWKRGDQKGVVTAKGASPDHETAA